jgi:hypothetical protein
VAELLVQVHFVRRHGLAVEPQTNQEQTARTGVGLWARDKADERSWFGVGHSPGEKEKAAWTRTPK